MTNISNTIPDATRAIPDTTTVQCGKWTFLSVKNQIAKVDKSIDTSSFGCLQSDPDKARSFWKKYFSEKALLSDPDMAVATKNITAQRDNAINQFLDGTISGNELSNTAKDLLSQFSRDCAEYGYPVPLLQEGPVKECITETFYSEFRREILAEAVHRNLEEGKQHLLGNDRKNWKYYNSDYFFQSESAIAAITKGVKEYAEENNVAFNVPDYKSKNLNLYYNFNTAFSNKFDVYEQYMLDPDQVPPKNFQWFYQSGSADIYERDDVCVTIKPEDIIEVKEGTPVEEEIRLLEEHERLKRVAAFDPSNPRTATTWVSYRDKHGVEHSASKDFFYDYSEKDLHNLNNLLQFPGETEVNRFLQNIQVYSTGYFERFPIVKGEINLSV